MILNKGIKKNKIDFNQINKLIPYIVETQNENIYLSNKAELRTILGVKQTFTAGIAYCKSKLLQSQEKRQLDIVSKIYSSIYSIPNEGWAKKKTNSVYSLRFSNEEIVTNGWFLFAVYVHLIDKILKLTKVENVIEIGSGRGNNIVALALKNPNIKFSGLEYSNNGVIASNDMVINPPPELLKIAGNSNLMVLNKERKKNVRFYRGNAFDIPFEDNSFDLSFTVLALEQMPHRFKDALLEMRRITRKYCVFIEPFAEANSIYGKLHLGRVDYFRYSYKSFLGAGLKPVYFTNNFPQKYKYQAGLLVTEVIG